MPNVGLNKLCFGTELTQFLLELFALLFAMARDNNVSARRSKSQSCCASNARKGSCDQNDLFRHNNSLSGREPPITSATLSVNLDIATPMVFCGCSFDVRSLQPDLAL